MTTPTSSTSFPWAFVLLLVPLSIPFWAAGAAPASLFPRIPLLDLPISALAAFVPLMAAAIIVFREQGAAGAWRFLKRAFDVSSITNRLWYLPILFLMPCLMVLEYGVMKLLGMPVPAPRFSAALLAFFPLFFLTAIGEELGWQGYAFASMRARWNALTGSLLLGTLWAIWHSVPFLQTNHSPSWVFWQSATTIGARVLIVWIFNNTGMSVFAAVLFHMMINVSEFSFPVYGSHYDPFIATILLTIAVVIVTVLWGPETLARFRYVRGGVTGDGYEL